MKKVLVLSFLLSGLAWGDIQIKMFAVPLASLTALHPNCNKDHWGSQGTNGGVRAYSIACDAAAHRYCLSQMANTNGNCIGMIQEINISAGLISIGCIGNVGTTTPPSSSSN